MDNNRNSNVIDLEELMRKKEQLQNSFNRFWKVFGKGKLLLPLLIVVILIFKFAFIYVEPNEYGIKIDRFGTNKGVQKQVYGAGLQFVIPAAQEMDMLPRDLQVLELTNYPRTASRFARIQRAAHIQTSDGFFVDVDVSILYKLIDPYVVFTTLGPGRLFEDNGIIPKTEPALKATLGELTTEQFYNSPLRVAKTERAKDLLNQELKSKGLEVEQVLVRYFRYSDEIQKNIEAKKLEDQLVFKNQAEGRAAVEEAKLKKIIQEGKVNVEVEMAGGHAYATKRVAEKDRYVRTKKAQANLLIKLAEAQKAKLKNIALEGKGADRMVGLKMADVYKGLDVIVLPSDGKAGINPLNLDRTLKMFDVRQGGEK